MSLGLCVSDMVPEPEEGPECPEDPSHGPMEWDDYYMGGRWRCRTIIREGRRDGQYCDGSALSDEDKREADLADRGDDE